MITRMVVKGLLLAALMPLPALAQDTSARAELEQAFDRLKALPGHVEIIYARSPAMPTATGVVADAIKDRLKEEATQKVQAKVATAGAKVQLASELAARGAAALGEQGARTLEDLLGPVRRIGTVEYAGKRERHTFLDSGYEMVRADGRVATRVNLAPQIAQLHLAAVSTGESMYREVRGAKATFQALMAQVRQGGVGGLFAISEIFDQLSAMRSTALTAASILNSIAALEKLSGKWQCLPDPLEATYTFKGKPQDVERTPDEVIDGTPAHVYDRTVRMVASGGETDRHPNFDVHTRTWVRIADGLPIRNEIGPPGSATPMHMDFEYPAMVTVDAPECTVL